jgi:hypothetical protein
MAKHTLVNLLAEVRRERGRQDAKFGIQDYPLVPGGWTRENYREAADAHKRINDRAIENGSRTGDHVLLEEVFEALSADGPLETVEELVQVAAVALLLAEMEIRRENARSTWPPHAWTGEGRLHGLCRLCGEGENVFAHRTWAQEPVATSVFPPLPLSAPCVCGHVKNWHVTGPQCGVKDCDCRAFEARITAESSPLLRRALGEGGFARLLADLEERNGPACTCQPPSGMTPGEPDGPAEDCPVHGSPAVLSGGYAIVPSGYDDDGVTVSMDQIRAALARPTYCAGHTDTEDNALEAVQFDGHCSLCGLPVPGMDAR